MIQVEGNISVQHKNEYSCNLMFIYYLYKAEANPHIE